MAKKTNPKKSHPRPSEKAPPAQPDSSQQDQPPSPPPPAQDPKHQQRLLNIFSSTFRTTLSSEALPALLQEVKQALYGRDFAAAFGREDYLEAYAARWSPTRALCYASVLQGVRRRYLEDLTVREEGGGVVEGGGQAVNDNGPVNEGSGEGEASTIATASGESKGKLKMLAIGGCAAEHVAFASFLHLSSLNGHLILLDSAPWSNITNLLQTSLTNPLTLSKYASAAAKASNTAFIQPSQLSVSFHQLDALAETEDSATLGKVIGSQEPLLVTLFFTLNELYTSGGIGKTTKFLASLERTLPERSLLLVVDSPGSYSEAAVGKEKKRYPMQWLLDHTLRDSDNGNTGWERLESHDSIWFRLPKDISYPMQLEDMRYQLHLYRRKADDQE